MNNYLNYSATAAVDGYVIPSIGLRAITSLSITVSGSCDWQLEATLDETRWYKLRDVDSSAETFGSNNAPVKFIVDNYKLARVIVLNSIGTQTVKAKGLYVATSVSSGGGSGTITGASNLAGDEGIFSGVSGSTLQFKSLTAGTNVTLSSDANAVTINASGGASGVSETTFQENKNAQNQINQSIRQSLDGYAVATSLTGLEQTEIEHYVQHSDAFKSILDALDGYGGASYIDGDGYAQGQVSPDADSVYKLGDPLFKWKEFYVSGPGGVHIQSELFETQESQSDAYIDNLGYITTIVGDGTSATSADPGTGTAATVSLVMGMDYVPSARAIVFADNVSIRLLHLDTNLVTRVAGSGTYGTTATSGSALSANLSTIRDVCYDYVNDRYFFTQPDEHRVKMVGTDGNISVVAGTGSSGNTGDGGAATSATLDEPFGVTIDSSGAVYVSDSNQNRIRKFTVGGTIANYSGASNGASGNTGDTGAATSATHSAPRGIAFDPAGTYFYIADVVNNRVRRVTVASGVINHFAGDSSGVAGNTGEGGAATVCKLSFPTDVAFDGYGNVYIKDTTNNVIKKVKSDGTIGTVVGDGHGRFTGDGGAALAASINISGANDPGIIFPEIGNTLYISDANSDRIRKVSFDFTPEISVPGGNIFRDYNLTVHQDNHNFLIRDGYQLNPQTLMAMDAEDGYVGFGTEAPTAALDLQNFVTGGYLKILSVGTSQATGVGYIEVEITAGVTGYIQINGSK